MKPFKETHPKDIVTRCLILEELRTVPPALILQLPKSFHKFVQGKGSAILDKKGNSQSDLSINWYYALFSAPQKELIDLFGFLDKKPKEENEKTG